MANFFSKKRKDITRRVYKTNQETQRVYTSPLPPKKEKTASGAVSSLWMKCSNCGSVLYTEDVENNLQVCPDCGFHFRLGARERIALTADQGSFCEFNSDLIGLDPLSFPGYKEKLAKMEETTGISEAIVTGTCTIGGLPCVLAVMDGFFIMGSMGAAVGEKFAQAAETALDKCIPLIAFTVSGGARMQEGLISLMQMGKTAAVLGRLDEEGIPYFVVLTDPTTGGVTASFGMLGDVILAEPNALIGFAGRRVVEQTVKQTLPPNFQRSEFLLEKGFVDRIVERKDMRDTLALLLELHREATL